MPNPRAQRQLTLDRVVSDLKSFAEPAQAMGDMMAGTLRGSVAATGGLGGDLESLGRGAISAFNAPSGRRLEAFGAGMEQPTFLPTTERVSAMLPSAVPQGAPASRQHTAGVYSDIGEMLPLPKSGVLAKGAMYGLGRGAGALTRGAGKAINDAMVYNQGPLAKGSLSFLAPQTATMHIIKPEGGNWLTDNVEKSVEPLRRHDLPDLFPEFGEPPPNSDTNKAINKWIDRNLTNYIKKEMATPKDPVRKLAEQNIVHMPPRQVGTNRYKAPERRTIMGGEQLGQSEAAKAWEDASDVSLRASLIKDLSGDYKEPWMANADPSTKIYSLGREMEGLGFDHIIDVLKQDVAEGRIRPEQLNKVSMEQAVRRTYEYDQEMARKMAEAQIKATEGMPVHKEYPEGYKWIELKSPPALTELPPTHKLEPYESKVHGGTAYRVINKETGMRGEGFKTPERATEEFLKSHAEDRLAEALNYEGETMGHCVGGYCPDVLEGRTRIFSLRDPRGEPHVTVEVRPNQARSKYETDWLMSQPEDVQDKITKQALAEHEATKATRTPEEDRFTWGQALSNAIKSHMGEVPDQIIQIKGKQNRAPKEEYLPYVQDFVRGGDWSDVGDFQNTGLAKLQENSDLAKWLQSKNIELPKYPTKQELNAHEADFLLEQLGPEKFDELGFDYLKDKGMKKGGKVSISDNCDCQHMEVMDKHMAGGGALSKAKGGAVKSLAKAVVENEKALPPVLPRAKPKTKEDIRPYAQEMAEAMSGNFVRPNPAKSMNPANKSFSQWKMEQTLGHDIRPKQGVQLKQQEIADIEKQLGQLKVGISGDTSISDKMLHRAGDYVLKKPSEQQGGPLFGLKGAPWASNIVPLRNLQTGVNELSRAHGDVPVLGQFMQMGPEGTNFAQHFADANLSAIDLTKMSPSQIESFNNLIAQGNAKSGKHPTFPGIQDPNGAHFYFTMYPELRKHFNALMTQPTYTAQHNLPDGRVILHAITEPELRDLPVTTTGFAQYPLVVGHDPLKLPFSKGHGTYSHDLPEIAGAIPTRAKYPTPAEIDFPDVTDYAINVKKYRPQDMTRVFQTATPRQIIDPQHVDEIKMYEELMKQYTGKKEGGEVKMDKGGKTSLKNKALGASLPLALTAGSDDPMDWGTMFAGMRSTIPLSMALYSGATNENEKEELEKRFGPASFYVKPAGQGPVNKNSLEREVPRNKLGDWALMQRVKEQYPNILSMPKDQQIKAFENTIGMDIFKTDLNSSFAKGGAITGDDLIIEERPL